MVIDAVICPRYWKEYVYYIYIYTYICIYICSFRPLGSGQLHELEIPSNKRVLFWVEFFFTNPKPRAFGAFSKWVCLGTGVKIYRFLSPSLWGNPVLGSIWVRFPIRRWFSDGHQSHNEQFNAATIYKNASFRLHTAFPSTSLSKKLRVE